MNRRSFLISLGTAAMGVMTSSLLTYAADSRILVAFFSATGTTKKVAGIIAGVLNGDLYEIKPEKAYTAADLDWHDKSSRSSVEMADKSARPKLSGDLPDLSGYEVVFLGYPIWWGVAPRLLQTFIEACDMKGKTVVPFCTSGGSAFARSDEMLIKASPSARWEAGKRLTPSVKQADIQAWAKELGLVLK